MSVEKRVAEAVARMAVNVPDTALRSICCAIEETAQDHCGEGGRGTYKQFINDNLSLITRIALGNESLHVNLGSEHPMIEPDPATGLCSIQDILYYAVRSGLNYNAGIPPDLSFSEEQKISCDKSMLTLPASFVYGLLVAVVACPANAGKTIGSPSWLQIATYCQFPVNKLWGKKTELLKLLNAIQELAT